MGGGRVIECNTKAEWDEHIKSGKTVRLLLRHSRTLSSDPCNTSAFFLLSVPVLSGAVNRQFV